MPLNFVFKAIALTILGTGAVIGGVYAYTNAQPKTWKDLLLRNGHQLLTTNKEYQTVFKDQQDKTIKSTKLNLNSYEELKKWCLDELNKAPTYIKSEKKQLVNLCSLQGIKTVKGRLSTLEDIDLIEDKPEKEQDKLYKIIFALYRFNDEFLAWLNEDNLNLTNHSEVDKNFSKLKDKCTVSLKTKEKDVTNPKLYDYTYWWCQPLSYKTIKDLLEKQNQDWKKEEDGAKIKEIWEKNIDVITKITEDLATQIKTLKKDEEYVSWCDKQLDTALEENYVFQNKYVIIKYLCRAYQTN